MDCQISRQMAAEQENGGKLVSVKDHTQESEEWRVQVVGVSQASPLRPEFQESYWLGQTKTGSALEEERQGRKKELRFGEALGR